ncbi:hypothetical protein HYW75_02740 [Candidatus Pacearchaeota archaeon]|nr:hypothetical protein [Candidatus Pacearchaeota archaeon]
MIITSREKVNKTRIELAKRIGLNSTLTREKYPILGHEARFVVFTSNKGLFERIMNSYNGPIFGEQILGSYEYDSHDRVINQHYAISHLLLKKLIPILKKTKEEYQLGNIEEEILVLAE